MKCTTNSRTQRIVKDSITVTRKTIDKTIESCIQCYIMWAACVIAQKPLGFFQLLVFPSWKLLSLVLLKSIIIIIRFVTTSWNMVAAVICFNHAVSNLDNVSYWNCTETGFDKRLACDFWKPRGKFSSTEKKWPTMKHNLQLWLPFHFHFHFCLVTPSNRQNQWN